MCGYVLVVDDDPSIRAVVRDVLDDEGIAVETACDGREAIERIAVGPPALMLLDMRMPVLDGWGVAAELRRQGLHVPIAVMTAAQDAGVWAREIDADATLPKPFDLSALLETVEGFIRPCDGPAA